MNLMTICAVIIIFKINPSYAHRQKLKPFTSNEYYIDSEQKYSWMESLVACTEMNMTLATIDSKTKSDEINTIVRNNFGNIKLWIGGLMSRFPNRHFVWLATGKPFSYANWFGHSPNFLGNIEYCVHIGKGKNLEWNDLACTHQQGFICEINRQQQRTLQLQIDLDDERKKQQQLQQELQHTNEKQQVLEKEMREKQTQQDSLKQELEIVKQAAEQEIRKHQQLQKQLKEEIDKHQNKLKQDLPKLEQDLQSALEKQRNLQHDLYEQQNLKQLLQEELNKLKGNLQKPPTEIILHFHQNQ